jgi:carbon starvation protein
MLRALGWLLVVVAGAVALAMLALVRGESVDAVWFVVAALSVYCVGYRFYSAFIAARIFALDAAHETPAVRINDGRDFVPTNRWVVFGHHFAAIAGPGPLIGPTLAAQFGYLPGTLWILVGVVLGGAVQDFCILCGSLRRDGRSLGQMAKDEIGPLGGFVTLTGVFFIMVILIAVLALVVVNALNHSPWGTVTVGLTIPIAMLMGWWMKFARPHDVRGATIM